MGGGDFFLCVISFGACGGFGADEIILRMDTRFTRTLGVRNSFDVDWWYLHAGRCVYVYMYVWVIKLDLGISSVYVFSECLTGLMVTTYSL